MKVRSMNPAASGASASVSQTDTSSSLYITTSSAKYGTTEVIRSKPVRLRSGRAYSRTASRQGAASVISRAVSQLLAAATAASPAVASGGDHPVAVAVHALRLRLPATTAARRLALRHAEAGSSELPVEIEVSGHARHIARLIVRDERDADARAAGACGSPDAVDVGLTVVRHVEVDHVRDVVDIEAAGSDVGGHEHRAASVLEAGEGALALALALVAVHRRGGDVARLQALHETVSAALGADEHERAPDVVAAELLDQVVDLGLVVDADEAMLHVVLALLGRTVLVTARIGRVDVSHAANLAIERCREEQRLALARGLGDDAIDDRAEAHVEHAVGLVEDEDAYLRKVDGAAGDEVLEAAGGGHDDVRLAGELRLALQACASVDGDDVQSAGMRDVADLLDDLRGKLTRRGEHERCLLRAVRVEPVDDRNSEGKRLA